MKVLIACEFSGIVREAFRKRGHDAWSCDVLDTEIPGQHIKGDVLEILNDGWDMMIAFPPCTHLAVSGARWFETKQVEQRNAIYFFKALWDAPTQNSHRKPYRDNEDCISKTKSNNTAVLFR